MKSPIFIDWVCTVYECVWVMIRIHTTFLWLHMYIPNTTRYNYYNYGVIPLPSQPVVCRYDEQMKDKNVLQKEDLSDMVAEHAAKQKVGVSVR